MTAPCVQAGTLILLLLLIPSGRALAQAPVYAWDNQGCPWIGEAIGPYSLATQAGGACVARASANGVPPANAFSVQGVYTDTSRGSICPDPPISAGVVCYVDIWDAINGNPPQPFGWETILSVGSPLFWIAGDATPLGDNGFSCPKNCVGDPINPAVGAVLTGATDIQFQGAGALAYRRFYNSNDIAGADGVPGWRHSYDRSINIIYANPIGADITPPNLTSSQYTTPAIACTTGFNDIKYSIPTWISATASYSNGLCVVSLNSVTIATLPIFSSPTNLPPQGSPIEYDVIRDDGQTLRYPVQGGAVTNPYGISIRLTLTGSGFTVTDDDDNVESYNTSGVLQSVTSRSGVVQTMSYSGGRLSVVTDSFGHAISIGRNAQNNVGSVSVSGGGMVQYAYNNAHQLTQVTNLDLTTQGYTYDPRFTNALTGIIDENGITYTTWTYDSYQRATHTQEVGGFNAVDLAYNSGISVSVTDAFGINRTFTYTHVGDINKVTAISGSQCPTCQESAATTYDTRGWVSSRKDYNGNLTCYGNDAVRGLEVVRVEGFAPGSTCPANLSTYTPQSGTLQRKITTVWNATWREPDSITEPNRTTGFTYDSYGNVLTKTITDTSVTPNVSRTWTYTYYNSGLYGQVHTVTGPRTDITTDVTTYAYYSCTSGAQCGNVNTVTNGLNQVTTVATYNVYGQPLTITDPNNMVTTLGYDTRERLTSRQLGTESTTFSYWPTGFLKRVTQPDNSYIQYTYDTAHRLTNIADGLGNSIAYTLDAMGNRTAENVYDPTSVLHRTHTRVFNTLNQLFKDINAAGTAAVTTQYGYDTNGNQTTIAAPLSRNTTNAYDALNRLNQITDPANGITQFGYDANDNLNSVKDPRNLSTSYVYNGFGEVTSQTSPDTGATTNTYDSAGNLKTSTDARGAISTYTYDALNRVSTIAYKLGSTTDQTLTFTYDTNTNGVGRLRTVADASHSTSWTYDAQGRVIGKGQTIGSVTKSVGYAFTNADLTTLTTPSNQSVTYTYDTNHQVASIAVNGTTILSNATYEPFGAVHGWTWGNNTFSSRVFDTDGRVSQIANVETSNFGYDDASRLTTLNNATNSTLNWTYGYDALDRVNSAVQNTTTYGFTYDANGNRLTQTGTFPFTLTPSTTSNRLVSTTGRTYSYNAAGSVLTDTAHTFTYNNRGRMKTGKTTSTTTTYVVNALGQRIKKSGGVAGTVLYMYDEAGHLLGEYNSTGALVQETVWLGDTPVATLRPNGASITIYYVHSDHLNTPKIVTRPSDNKQAWRWDQDPFGTVVPVQNPQGLGTFVYNLRYPGQYYDSETGLNYNYARDYDAQIGRYVENDPIGLAGGSNVYAYVGGNPIRRVDPFGLTEQDVGIIQQYIDQHFPDIHRSGGYQYGDLSEDESGSTAVGSGITTLPKAVRCKVLSEDEFEQLFDTMLHESMHSTDPMWRRAWDSVWGNENLTAHHQSIYNRTIYELLTGHRFSIGPMWGKPTSLVPDVQALYAGSRSQGDQVPCGCKK
jgi:RHS repeat-associated protein